MTSLISVRFNEFSSETRWLLKQAEFTVRKCSKLCKFQFCCLITSRGWAALIHPKLSVRNGGDLIVTPYRISTAEVQNLFDKNPFWINQWTRCERLEQVSRIRAENFCGQPTPCPWHCSTFHYEMRVGTGQELFFTGFRVWFNNTAFNYAITALISRETLPNTWLDELSN